MPSPNSLPPPDMRRTDSWTRLDGGPPRPRHPEALEARTGDAHTTSYAPAGPIDLNGGADLPK